MCSERLARLKLTMGKDQPVTKYRLVERLPPNGPVETRCPERVEWNAAVLLNLGTQSSVQARRKSHMRPKRGRPD